MTKLRVHNLAVSLDGFATGEGQGIDAPFGHAEDRLMRWFFPTRTFVSMTGHDDEAVGAGRRGVDDAFAGGGPTVVREFLDADLVDHLHVVVVPIVLGRGVRLWDGLERLEERFAIEVTASPSGSCTTC